MCSIETRTVQAIESLQQLQSNPRIRPYLFRTRFERTMIKLQILASECLDKDLEKLATDSLRKIRSIVDKSNSTSDGVLRSYTILEPDIENMLEILQNKNATTMVLKA